MVYAMNAVAICIVVLMALYYAPIAAETEPEPLDVEIKASIDGTKQQYVVLLPPRFKAESSHHILICLHRHGSDRWQYIKKPDEIFIATREAVKKHNMILVSPEYRGASWMGPKAEADMIDILNELRKKYKVGKIIISAGSMGGPLH
jgi:hypothetical protein